MRPVLKPPGSMLLKLRFSRPLSDFAFKFNLRRYTMAAAGVPALVARVLGFEAGRCRLTPDVYGYSVRCIRI
jgi:hypothetical protein